MSFKDLIKNAIFEEEPGAKQQQPVRPVQHASSVAMPPSPHYDASETAPPVASDSQFYTRVAKQTDLSVVPELAKIESFAAPLKAVIPEKSLRYKAALATAQSQGGLTREAILKSFDTLLSVLDSSAARLQQAKASFAAAYARRKSEIEQQRREFETILQ